jgi:tRNA(Ile)-lysidine synthase
VDKTNLELDATRNKICLDILPKLEEYIPGATANIARFAMLAGEDDELLCELAKELLEETEEKFFVHFCDKKPLFTRAVLMALKALGLHKDYTSVHLDAAFYLQQSERGATLDLPQNICAEKQVGGIYLYCKKEEYYPPLSGQMPFSLEGFDGGRYEVIVSNDPSMHSEEGWKTLRLDKEKLPQNAVFRFRKEGDKIKAYGGDTKTLKKLLNERKIPVHERAYLPLIADKDEAIVYAVCGVEISENIKVDEGTKEALYIAIRKRGNK